MPEKEIENGKLETPPPRPAPVMVVTAEGREVENVDNDGVVPVEGDRIRIYRGRTVIQKVYHAPPVGDPEPVYVENFDSKQLLAALLEIMTSDQALTALQVPAIAAQLNLLQLRTRPISITEPGYQSAIAGLVAAGALGADQGNVLSTKGVRV